MQYEELSQLIFNRFIEEFKSNYDMIDIKGKAKILKYISSYYKKWYYSSLVEDTILTPSNLLIGLNEEYNKEITTTLTPKMSTTARMSNIKFETLEYHLSEHHIVNDLEKFLKSCIPDFELSEKFELSEEHKLKLLPELSIFDPFYVEFLCIVAYNLELIKSIPSIHSNKAQLTDNYEKLFKLEKRQIFDKIVKISITIAKTNINDSILINAIGVEPITDEYLLSILKEPLTTDEIFSHVFQKMGLNIGDMFLGKTDIIMEEAYDSMIISSFRLGVAIDKYFFTVFGYYFKLINPIYLLPCFLAHEMLFSIETLENNENLSIAIFSPCSKYELSNLGYEFFGIQNQCKLQEIFNKSDKPSKIVKSLESKKQFEALLRKNLDIWQCQDILFNTSEMAYTIKVKIEKYKMFWKKFEFLEQDTLQDLYVDICHEFYFDANFQYSFFQDINESPFLEYTSATRVKKGKTWENPVLKDFVNGNGHKFKLVLFDVMDPYILSETFAKKIKLEIEILGTKKVGILSEYPKLISEGVVFQYYDFK